MMVRGQIKTYKGCDENQEIHFWFGQRPVVGGLDAYLDDLQLRGVQWHAHNSVQLGTGFLRRMCSLR